MADPEHPAEPSTNELAAKRTALGHERTDMAVDRTGMATSRTDIAYERTRLASDRTTMAYVRTAVSLIGFGFTIYKFFQYMADVPGFETLPSVGARNLGVSLLFLGAAMLTLAVIQQIIFMKRLSKDARQAFPISIALVSSIALLAIGMLALVRIFFHIGPF